MSTLKYDDEYFMNLAIEESKNSDCRRKVGAVIVRDNKVLSKGYNASPNGVKSCIECGGCMRQKNNIPSGTRQEFCKAVHAEQNAIINACLNETSIKGATLYVTTYPCSICTRMLINCMLEKIVYQGDYQDDLAHDMLNEAGILVEKIKEKSLN